MKSPLHGGYLFKEVVETESTQILARKQLQESGDAGVILTRLQTAGVGRLGRPWLSGRDDSLTMTMIFRSYADHPKPYLIGMAAALAVAGELHAQVQWPNDVVIEGRKLGGVLTEMASDPQGRKVALVGVGVNLNQKVFSEEIADRAVSLALARGGTYDPIQIAHAILKRLAGLPEPNDWSDLALIWSLFDRTEGKHYRLPDDKEAIAIAIGSAGQLICSINGESQSVFAADAIFGPQNQM